MLGSLKIILQSQLFSICTPITQFVCLFLHNLRHPKLLSRPCKLDFEKMIMSFFGFWFLIARQKLGLSTHESMGKMIFCLLKEGENLWDPRLFRYEERTWTSIALLGDERIQLSKDIGEGKQIPCLGRTKVRKDGLKITMMTQRCHHQMNKALNHKQETRAMNCQSFIECILHGFQHIFGL